MSFLEVLTFKSIFYYYRLYVYFFLSNSVDVLELSDKTNSVQTHPPKIAIAEKSKSVAAEVMENLALLIFKNPEKFVENYWTKHWLCCCLRVTFKASPLNLR